MSETMTAADWSALLRLTSPLLAVLLAAAVVLVHARLADEDASSAGGGIALAGLLVSAVLTWMLWPQMEGQRLAMLVCDRTTAVAWLIIACSALAAVLSSFSFLHRERLSGTSYFALMLLAVFGMGVLVAAGDLVVLLVGGEVASLSITALVGYTTMRASSLEGALKHFLMGAFATAFIAMGIAFLFGSAGTTDMALLAQRADEIVHGDGRAFFLFGCAMIAIGFAFKMALVPFHAWAPDASDGAPTPVASFMATAAIAAAAVAFLRFADAAAAHGGRSWQQLTAALAIGTMAWGSLAALRQDRLGRLLASAAIAQAGSLLIVFPSLSSMPTEAARAVVLSLAALAVMTSGAFAAVAALETRGGGGATMASVAGLWSRRPWFAAAFAIVLASLAGFPPTLGFLGKCALFQVAVRHGDIGLVVAGALISVVTAFAYLRLIIAMAVRDRSGGRDVVLISPALVGVQAVAAVAVVIFGFFPQDIVAFIWGSIAGSGW